MLHPKDVVPLPAGIVSPTELAGEWIIARVRGGYERKLVLLLANVAPGIGYFLPMERRVRLIEGQKRGTYTRLIFPSYLFVCCRHEDDFYELVSRDGVFERIAVREQGQFVREVEAFQIAADNGLLRAHEHRDIKPGIKCEIIRGPLEGHVGWIDEVIDKTQRVIIKVTILGDSCPTTIPIDDVRPL